MTPMDEAWLILKYEGGFFTQRPPIEGGEKRFADYERELGTGSYSGHMGDNYYNALFQQEEVAALNEAIRQELKRQMDAKSDFHFMEVDAGLVPDASPMMGMRDHNFPKVGEPSPPRGFEGNFVMRPYRGPDNYKGRLPIKLPIIRYRDSPDSTFNMKNHFDRGGEFIGQ